MLTGDLPSPANPPSGCVFRTRCPIAVASCADVRPSLVQVDDDHVAACPVRVDAADPSADFAVAGVSASATPANSTSGGT